MRRPRDFRPTFLKCHAGLLHGDDSRFRERGSRDDNFGGDDARRERNQHKFRDNNIRNHHFHDSHGRNGGKFHDKRRRNGDEPRRTADKCGGNGDKRGGNGDILRDDGARGDDEC